MRKPRDYNAELEALEQKAKALKARLVTQLGEVVIATGADQLAIEELAGALLGIADTKDAATREAWRKRGAAFFCGEHGSFRQDAGSKQGSAQQGNGSAQPPASATGAA
jgi:hypothetical protein